MDLERMRRRAREVVRSSSLIGHAFHGDRSAAEVLHIGFWPFVREFERAIDRHPFPTRSLIRRFGPAARDKLHVIAGDVRAMRDEEDVHSKHWQEDARSLGLQSLEGPIAPKVVELLRRAYAKDHTRFFTVLAGTELVAEELGAFLISSRAFTELFDRKRWIWGEIHVASHGDRPSHLDIDLDLARATASDPQDAARLEAWVVETIELFAEAAVQVEGGGPRT
ncbi:MAG TPA: hypothetical protein VJV78_39065 [Polyangiales bacterium]|nr:hypothetical protein [Polyangiales bacterium]